MNPPSTVRAVTLTLVFALALAATATACSSYRLVAPQTLPVQPFHPPPAEVAQVCVVRTSALALAVTFLVRDNGTLVGATRGPTYFCYQAAPGRHRLVTETDDDTETLVYEAARGERRYLHQGVVNMFGFVKSESSWVAESEAHELVGESDYSILVGVPGTEKLPAPVPFAP